MTINALVPHSTLLLFKAELWKDQRRLETVIDGGTTYLVKHFGTEPEAALEVELLDHLAQTLVMARVPAPAAHRGTTASFPYIRGIRVFNLLVELDRLSSVEAIDCAAIKNDIVNRCDAQQKDIQRALLTFQAGRKRSPYPAALKVRSIIQLLADCLGIVVHWEVLDRELGLLHELWQPWAVVPFRDATTKNMVLAASELWLGNFDSEEARRDFLLETLREKKCPTWLEAPIVDFDFSSCAETSTPEDDPVSLLFHERTWRGTLPSADDLVWSSSPNPVRAAITFLVRYYRFGGRKAAYRMLHPTGHRIRFRHDHDSFYFRRLPALVRALWPGANASIPEILAFTEAVGRDLDDVRPEIDLFMAAGLGEKRRYYVDMYPE